MANESSPHRAGEATRRFLITGCRNWKCTEVAEWVVGSLLKKYGPEITLVHGMAPGVDTTFASVCRLKGIPDEPHPADWDAYGKAAGPRRNQEMVDAGAMFAVAVHRDLQNSRGTGDCVRRCLGAGIPVYHVDNLHSVTRIRSHPF